MTNRSSDKPETRGCALADIIQLKAKKKNGKMSRFM